MKAVIKSILILFSVLIYFMITAPIHAQTAPNYSLSPATSNLAPGSSQSIRLRVNSGSYTASSMEIAIDVTGTSVPTNLALTPITPSGMSVMTNTIVNITGGRQIQFIVVGSGQGTGINTGGANVDIGNITFTNPTSGSANFTLNPASVLFADLSGNILGSYFSETYTFAAAPSNTPIPPSPTTVPPTPTRTPTPIPPTPTRTPTPIPPTPTTPPAAMTLTANFRLQGLTTQVPARPIILDIRNANSTTTRYTNTLTPTVSADGVHTVTTPTLSLGAGSYKICLKGGSHLRHCWDNFSLTSGTNTLTATTSSADLLLVGDVNGDNIINLDDISSINNAYCGFKVAVGSQCSGVTVTSAQDVNYDNFVTIDDLALALMNFSDFVLRGND